MSRLRSLDPPHKGIRYALGIVQTLAGTTDYTNTQELEYLKVRCRELFRILHDHAHTEEKFILGPLELRHPGASVNDHEDHIRIESVLEQLEQQLESLKVSENQEQGHEFYLSLSEFNARYLEHIGREDRVTEKLMQQHFTDEEMMAHQGEIMKEMPFDMLLLWFRYIAPARRHEENLQVLQGLKASAPPAAIEAVLGTLKEALPQTAYDRLMQSLR